MKENMSKLYSPRPQYLPHPSTHAPLSLFGRCKQKLHILCIWGDWMYENIYFCVSCLQLSVEQVDWRQWRDSKDPPHPSTSTDDMVSWRLWYIHMTCVSMWHPRTESVSRVTDVFCLFQGVAQSPVTASEGPTDDRVRWQVPPGKWRLCLLSPSHALTTPPTPMTLAQVSPSVPTRPRHATCRHITTLSLRPACRILRVQKASDLDPTCYFVSESALVAVCDVTDYVVNKS